MNSWFFCVYLTSLNRARFLTRGMFERCLQRSVKLRLHQALTDLVWSLQTLHDMRSTAGFNCPRTSSARFSLLRRRMLDDFFLPFHLSPSLSFYFLFPPFSVKWFHLRPQSLETFQSSVVPFLWSVMRSACADFDDHIPARTFYLCCNTLSEWFGKEEQEFFLPMDQHRFRGTCRNYVPQEGNTKHEWDWRSSTNFFFS